MCSVCLCLQAEWEKLFIQASLNMVMIKKSFYGSVLFLGKKRTPEKQSVTLSVDASDYKWVETLKVCLH